ncbi:MAG: hypothetical protein Q8Q29_07570, partial [Actinomycetota bacterium]|nr:hypothetical protein [Actinomycetota bacterium]
SSQGTRGGCSGLSGHAMYAEPYSPAGVLARVEFEREHFPDQDAVRFFIMGRGSMDDAKLADMAIAENDDRWVVTLATVEPAGSTVEESWEPGVWRYTVTPAHTWFGDVSKFGEALGMEVFEAGVRKGRTYTESDLDDMVAAFEANATGGVPLVIGHDEDQDVLQASDIPACGWARSLRRVGRKLVADFSDVPAVVLDVIRAKAYRKRSAEIYQSFTDAAGKAWGKTLRRVALLGGDIPEVKSLQDVVALQYSSASSDAEWIEFNEEGAREMATKPKVQKNDEATETQDGAVGGAVPAVPPTVEPKAQDAAPVVAPAPEVKAVEPPPVSAEEFREAVKRLAGAETTIAKLNESNSMLKEELEARKAEVKAHAEKFAEADRRARKAELAQFFEGLRRSGRVTPAELSSGKLMALAEKLAERPDVITFREKVGGEEKDVEGTTISLFREVLGSRQPVVPVSGGQDQLADETFGEATLTQEAAGRQLAKFAEDLVGQGKAKNISEAVRMARKAHPDLDAIRTGR